MIARKVHNHIPINELNHSCFNKYIVSRKEIKKGSNIWNIDKLNEYEEFTENIQKVESAAILSQTIKPKKKLSEQQQRLNTIRKQVKEQQLQIS